MSGNKILIDTNIAIYHLNGDKTLESILEGKDIYVSFITAIELQSLTSLSRESETIIERFLSFVKVIHSNDQICKMASIVRRRTKIKTPDSIIAATSLYLNLPLLTSDKVFHKIDELSAIEYEPNRK
jgi:predicted nucleic acid-binding protein